MKKCLALILMLCLLTVTAIADTVYQDDTAPALVQATVAADQIKLVDVGEREDLEDAALAALLEAALLNPENPEVVSTDLFHVTVPAEATLTFASDAVAVYFTKDGAEWTALAAECANGTVTVTVAETGVLLFQKPVAEGEAEPADEVTAPETETYDVFTPSVTGKLAPEMMPVDEEGNVAEIVDAAGEKTAVPAAWIVVTPLSGRVYNPDVLTYEHLEWAFADALAGNEAIPADLVISDLFDVAVYGEYWKQLNVEGNKMTITFAAEFAQDDVLVVLHSDEIGAWHEVPAENVTINADGTVTLVLEHDGTLAFMVEKADAIPGEGAVTAP